MGPQRQPLRGAVGDEQVRDPCHDDVAGDGMGTLRHRLNTIAPGEIPTEGMSKRLNPGDEAGARTIARTRWAASAKWRSCRTSRCS